jgi:hypothetical protein
MENDRDESVPREVKIVHIHKGKDDESSFIESIRLKNGKPLILQWNSFIKRYGVEMIEEFIALK